MALQLELLRAGSMGSPSEYDLDPMLASPMGNVSDQNSGAWWVCMWAQLMASQCLALAGTAHPRMPF